MTYLSIPEAAKYIDRSEAAVRKLVDRRQIPFSKTAGRIRLAKEKIDQWMEDGEVETKSENEKKAAKYISRKK